MLLLFAGGVMNIGVILALTAWVAIEKLAPFGQQSARVSGALLLARGGVDAGALIAQAAAAELALSHLNSYRIQLVFSNDSASSPALTLNVP